MTLTAEQNERLTQWLRDKGKHSDCPFCGENDWIPGLIIAAPTVTEHNITFSGKKIPMVQLVCGNCGYVHLFAAVMVFGELLTQTSSTLS